MSVSRGSSLSRYWYDWFAPFYDPLLGIAEGHSFAEWRRLLWSKVEGKKILEVGVGTGRSFPFYPAGKSITAIDVSRSMLKRAREKARKQNIRVELELMDVQEMKFAGSSFDTVVSSLVFCEIRDPLKGLAEVKRVVRPGGKVTMLEHVISDKPGMAGLMNLINPPITFLTGENINRNTAANVEKSGLIVEKVNRLSSIFRLIEARKEDIP